MKHVCAPTPLSSNTHTHNTKHTQFFFLKFVLVGIRTALEQSLGCECQRGGKAGFFPFFFGWCMFVILVECWWWCLRSHNTYTNTQPQAQTHTAEFGAAWCGDERHKRGRTSTSPIAQVEMAYCVLCTVYCVLCTVYCVLCTVYCVLCTVYCVLWPA